MKLLGVYIDFSKNYTPQELQELEDKLDKAFGQFVNRMLWLMAGLIVLAALTKLIYQLVQP